jgi:hypothetical protein
MGCPLFEFVDDAGKPVFINCGIAYKVILPFG